MKKVPITQIRSFPAQTQGQVKKCRKRSSAQLAWVLSYLLGAVKTQSLTLYTLHRKTFLSGCQNMNSLFWCNRDKRQVWWMLAWLFWLWTKLKKPFSLMIFCQNFETRVLCNLPLNLLFPRHHSQRKSSNSFLFVIVNGLALHDLHHLVSTHAIKTIAFIKWGHWY